MDVANLQVQGLCMAVEALQRLLVAKGVVTASEIETAFHAAELDLVQDDRAVDDLAPAQRDALVFPLRLLRHALRSSAAPTFTDLAAKVGEDKPRYNDQM